MSSDLEQMDQQFSSGRRRTSLVVTNMIRHSYSKHIKSFFFMTEQMITSQFSSTLLKWVCLYMLKQLLNLLIQRSRRGNCNKRKSSFPSDSCLYTVHGSNWDFIPQFLISCPNLFWTRMFPFHMSTRDKDVASSWWWVTWRLKTTCSSVLETLEQNLFTVS